MDQTVRDNKSKLYPCSTKTREVLGNPSPPPNFSRVEGNPRDFPRPWVLYPETREISRGRSPREISRVEGNLHSMTTFPA